MWSQSHPPPTCQPPPIEAQAAPVLGQGRIGEVTEPGSPASAPRPLWQAPLDPPISPPHQNAPSHCSSEAKDTLWMLLSPILQVSPEPVASQRHTASQGGSGTQSQHQSHRAPGAPAGRLPDTTLTPKARTL